jgi:hypothetical protein
MTTLLEDALRKVAALPRDEQEAIAAQIMETLRDEAVVSPKRLRKNTAAAKRGLSMNSCD